MRSDQASISYRAMKPGEESIVVDLVLKNFNEFVAPLFSQEGVLEFNKYISIDAFTNRMMAGNIIILAESGERIIGVIEVRENSHIALFFVEKSQQRKGIGKELIRQSINVCKERKPDFGKMTVNSSPNAFTAYQNIGFKKVEDEKVVNGIRFIPMELVLENRGGSDPQT